MFSKKQVQLWLEEEKMNLVRIGIPISRDICPEIRFSKATSWYGLCERNKIHDGRMYNFRICISGYHLHNDERSIRNTLIHELLHTCPGCQNHGLKWKTYANLVKGELGYDIRRCGGDKGKSDALVTARKEKRENYSQGYVLVCKKCGSKHRRMRKSKAVLHPELYRCHCGGELESYILK